MEFTLDKSRNDAPAGPFLSWLPVEEDNNSVSKLMELVEDDVKKKNSVGFIGGNPYWPPQIFQSASSCIKGNVESCGSSLSNSNTSVMVSPDMAGILGMEGQQEMLFGVDTEEGEGSWDPFAEPKLELKPEPKPVKSSESAVPGRKIETIIMEDSIEELEWNDEVLARFLGEDFLE